MLFAGRDDTANDCALWVVACLISLSRTGVRVKYEPFSPADKRFIWHFQKLNHYAQHINYSVGAFSPGMKILGEGKKRIVDFCKWKKSVTLS